jgi:hypothetical protein
MFEDPGSRNSKLWSKLGPHVGIRPMQKPLPPITYRVFAIQEYGTIVTQEAGKGHCQCVLAPAAIVATAVIAATIAQFGRATP